MTAQSKRTTETIGQGLQVCHTASLEEIPNVSHGNFVVSDLQKRDHARAMNCIAEDAEGPISDEAAAARVTEVVGCCLQCGLPISREAGIGVRLAETAISFSIGL